MKRNTDFLNGSLARGIPAFAIPILFTSVLQLLFNAADLIVVGRYCGSIYVAAISATGSLSNLIVTLFIGLSVGAGVAVAHGLGGRQEEAVSRTVHTAIPTALLCGLALSIVGITLAEKLLSLMDTPANVLALSATYMRIYFAGIPFMLVYNFSAAMLRAAGDTKSPMVYLTIAGIVNVILNIIFATVFGMNVDGVALATTISQVISAVLTVLALIRQNDACHLELKKLRIYAPQLNKIIYIGLPAGIQGIMFALSNVIIQSSVNSFQSDAILSGNGAASNIEGFVLVMMNSFHQASLNYIGQNVGAHKFDRVKKTFGLSIAYVTLVGLVAGVGVWLLRHQLLSLYITDSPVAITTGVLHLTYVCLPYFIYGIVDTITGSMRGLGSSIPPMVISVLGICGIRILWIYTIFRNPLYHTLDCLYLSYPISWVLTLVAELIVFIFLFKRKVRAYHQ